jgi:hypothetical protein
MFAVTGMNAPIVAGFQTSQAPFSPRSTTLCALAPLTAPAGDCASRSGRDAICAATNPQTDFANLLVLVVFYDVSILKLQ